MPRPSKKAASAGAERLARHRQRTARLDRQIPIETMAKLKALAQERETTVVAVLVELIDTASKQN